MLWVGIAQLTSQTRGIVGSVLAPACRVWLRSQVSHVDDIQVDIAGGSLQILGGTIPRIAVGAVGAIYQGLSLGSIDLIAENIRINLPQVLKGQPLGLLEAISVTANVKFSEGDLQASLSAPLLSQAITDLFTQILGANSHQSNLVIEWTHVQIAPQQLVLQGNLTTERRYYSQVLKKQESAHFHTNYLHLMLDLTESFVMHV